LGARGVVHRSDVSVVGVYPVLLELVELQPAAAVRIKAGRMLRLSIIAAF
jgi:hypothetical protein